MRAWKVCFKRAILYSQWTEPDLPIVEETPSNGFRTLNQFNGGALLAFLDFDGHMRVTEHISLRRCGGPPFPKDLLSFCCGSQMKADQEIAKTACNIRPNWVHICQTGQARGLPLKITTDSENNCTNSMPSRLAQPHQPLPHQIMKQPPPSLSHSFLVIFA